MPDPRLDYLAELYQAKKRTPAHLELVDIPGFSLADSQGQAEFRKAMQTGRRSDGLIMVVRAFESESVAPYRERIDPQADLEELHTELIFADLEQVSNRIEKLEASVQKATKTRDQDQHELALMQRIREALENEDRVDSAIHHDDEKIVVSSFGFLTLKPVITVVNVGEDEVAKPPPFEDLHARATIALAAEIEAEISQLDEADRTAFQQDLGLTEPAKTRLIHTCYDALGLISFFTCGSNEVRATTVIQGTPVIEAAGKIHTDMQRGFIGAEIVAFDDLEANKDMRGAKAAGKVHVERSKQHEVKDGDVIHFRFNV
jgi:GTP-binding protein YchF